MDSTDVAHVKRRARAAYELGRVRVAVLGVAPILAVVAVATCLSYRPLVTLWLGAATIAAGAVMLWYGCDPQRAVLPGILAGLAPLAIALCANNMHGCGSGWCASWCIRACALGGTVAGIAIVSVGHQSHESIWFWLPASGLTLLVGSMGCASMGCASMGYSGVVGLGVGFAFGMVLGLLRSDLMEKVR